MLTSSFRVASSAFRALISSELSWTWRGVMTMRGLCFKPSVCTSQEPFRDETNRHSIATAKDCKGHPMHINRHQGNPTDTQFLHCKMQCQVVSSMH